MPFLYTCSFRNSVLVKVIYSVFLVDGLCSLSEKCIHQQLLIEIKVEIVLCEALISGKFSQLIWSNLSNF